MKKSLIALAALATVAGAAQAQSSATVYGIIDSGYLSTERVGPTSATSATQITTESKGVSSSASASSRLGFRGVEDLGGGLKAEFVLETNINATDSTMSNMGNRQSFVGVNGGFGTFRVGTQYTHHHTLAASMSPSVGVNMAGDLNYSQGQSAGALTNLALATNIANGTATTGAAAINAITASAIAATGVVAIGDAAGATAADLAANIALANLGLNNGVVASSGTAWATDGAPTSGIVVDFIKAGAAATAATTNETAGNLKTLQAVARLITDAERASLNARLALANSAGYTVRNNNTLSYTSPTMSGLQIGLQYNAPTTSKIEGGNETKATSQSASLNYAAGKFAAGLAHSTSKSEARTINVARSANPGSIQSLTTIASVDSATALPTANVTSVAGVAAGADPADRLIEVKGQETMAAASYNLGFAKVGYTYAAKKAKDTTSDLINRKAHSINVSAPLTAKVSVWANYADGKQDVLVTNKYDLNAMQVGARYAFSKRTDVYAIYGQTKMDRKDSSVDLKDTQYAFGLRHSF